jgi:hypothetical protein
MLLGHASVQTTGRYVGRKQDLVQRALQESFDAPTPDHGPGDR